jgi:hypothetical protein
MNVEPAIHVGADKEIQISQFPIVGIGASAEGITALPGLETSGSSTPHCDGRCLRLVAIAREACAG